METATMVLFGIWVIVLMTGLSTLLFRKPRAG